MIYRGYKYRIYPNAEQRAQIDATFTACRCVYNLALEIKIHAYRQHGIRLSAFDLMKQLPDLKKDQKWIRDVDSQALLAAIKPIDIAFEKFFKGAGYPKFKSKYGLQSFQCPGNKREIDWDNKKLIIPKITNIPIRLSQKFEGKIKTVTISRTSTGKYYASVLVEQDIVLPKKAAFMPEKTIGIDLGISHFAIFDNGEKVENPKYLEANMKRLKVLQRRASRKKKGSKNRKKANRRVAILHEKISNQRRDFLHKLTSRIIRPAKCENQATTICVETLRVNNMMKNHSLAGAISSASWGEFVRQLEYKSAWAGINFIKIGAFEASTKTCSSCDTKK